MSPPRIAKGYRIETALVEQVKARAAAARTTETAIVEAAIHQFVSDEYLHRREAQLTKRLDHHSRQLDAIRRELEIVGQTVAGLVQHHLSVTPALPDDQRDAARAMGKRRFDQFCAHITEELKANRGYFAILARDFVLQPSDFEEPPK